MCRGLKKLEGREAFVIEHESKFEKIERLLSELKHEITTGLVQGEIPEYLTYSFIFPESRHISGAQVKCDFTLRPQVIQAVEIPRPELRLVVDND